MANFMRPTDEEIERAHRSRQVKYRGYFIEEKKDFSKFGYYIEGFHVRHGYVVTNGGMVNVMPGATWFLTADHAKEAIDDLLAVDPARNSEICTTEAIDAASLAARDWWIVHRARVKHRSAFDPIEFVNQMKG